MVFKPKNSIDYLVKYQEFLILLCKIYILQLTFLKGKAFFKHILAY